jgi:hypothetical protein
MLLHSAPSCLLLSVIVAKPNRELCLSSHSNRVPGDPGARTLIIENSVSERDQRPQP